MEIDVQAQKPWGLGILNTSIMNQCLMIKWWWKIMSAEDQPLWLSILKAKYFPSSSPMFALPRGGSQFWKSLVKVRPVFNLSLSLLLGTVPRLGVGLIGGVEIHLSR